MNHSILSVVGARPNFMKLAPVHRAIVRQGGVESRILHTGQHYDRSLSDIFFEELDLPTPHAHLGVGSGSHAQQTAGIMLAFERYVLEQRPSVAIVYGDVNSTVASALVCSKLGIPIAHVEAGLRSFDRGMPEEINRVVTDGLSDFLYVSEPSGLVNLRREGIAADKVAHVGNVMIDSLVRHVERARERSVHSRFGVEKKRFALVTLHRPSNVDDLARLERNVGMVLQMAERIPVLFPVHPRTRQRLELSSRGVTIAAQPCLQIIEPLGYLDFLSVMADACVVITDSGGIQEETTYLGIPCITFRTTTERPITVEVGTNEVVGDDPDYALRAFDRVLSGDWKQGTRPALWDGAAAERIVNHLLASPPFSS